MIEGQKRKKIASRKPARLALLAWRAWAAEAQSLKIMNKIFSFVNFVSSWPFL